MTAFRPEHELEPVNVPFIEVTDSCLEVEVPQMDSAEAESELLLLEIVCISSLHCDGVKSAKTARTVQKGILYCEKNLSALLCNRSSSILQLRPVQ